MVPPAEAPVGLSEPLMVASGAPAALSQPPAGLAAGLPDRRRLCDESIGCDGQEASGTLDGCYKFSAWMDSGAPRVLDDRAVGQPS